MEWVSPSSANSSRGSDEDRGRLEVAGEGEGVPAAAFAGEHAFTFKVRSGLRVGSSMFTASRTATHGSQHGQSPVKLLFAVLQQQQQRVLAAG